MAKSVDSGSPIESCSHATLPEPTQAKLLPGPSGGSAELPFRVISTWKRTVRGNEQSLNVFTGIVVFVTCQSLS